MNKKNIYTILFLILTCINSTIINAMLDNTPELYNILELDDIGIAKSITTNYLKNIYLYAPKQDQLRILIRSLWHIFYGQENDQLIPTKKGPIAIITPEIFGTLINHIYINIKNQEKDKELIDKLIIKHNWAKLYSQYLPQEIRDIENIINYFELELKKIDQKLEELNKRLEYANNNKLKHANTFDTLLKESKNAKTNKLKEINQKFIKKSPEKEIAIKKALEEINEKYNINNFKKSRDEINLEIEKIKEEQLEKTKEKKNIIDENKNKNLELTYKIKLSQYQENILLEINNTIKDLLLKIRLSYNSELYLPRITYGVLWAFFMSKFNTNENLKTCLQQLNVNLKNKYINLKNFEYTKNFNTEFEKKIKFLSPKEQVSILFKNYAQSLYKTIELTKKCKFPSEIKMGRFIYEYYPGKITDKFSDCFECTMLDLFNVLIYNPFTKKYDPTLIPQDLISGKGLKKIIKVLKYSHIADKNKLTELDFNIQNGCTNFTSLKKLKTKLLELGITKSQINQTKLSDINSCNITSSLVRQEFINITSGLEQIKYNQSDKKCEILPLVENFINILNLFYGTNAKNIEDFGPILSFENSRTKTKRVINFELKDGERPIITIKINYTSKNGEQNLLFSIKITLMKHHTTLELKEREQNQNSTLKDLATNVVPELFKNFEFENEISSKLTPFFALTINKKTLKSLPLNLKLILFAYFSLNIKDPNIQLAIAKHALNNNLLHYPEIKKLLFKIKTKLCQDKQTEYKFIKYIIKSGAYLNYPELKEYLTKRATQTLSVICKPNININKKTFYELQEYLIKNGANINAKCEPNGDTLLIKTIKEKYFDLTKILIKNKEIDLNQTGQYNQTALHAAATSGNIEIISELLDNKLIDANLLDNKNNTPLNLAIENNKLEAVKFILKNKKSSIPKLKTPLHSACTRNNENMLNFLLSNPETNNFLPDYNNNMPIHIAAFYGHTNLVQILTNLPNSDINISGYKNRTALNLATKNNKLNTVIWLLKHQNTNPNIQDSGGYTPLNRAVKNNFTNIVKELISHKNTDINLSDRWGYSPIFWATRIEILKILIQNKNLNINHQDNRKKTPLYWASTKGNTHFAKILLTHKEIIPDIANFLGKTPLSVALNKNYIEIANLIEKHKIKTV